MRQQELLDFAEGESITNESNGCWEEARKKADRT
jgi:hypothetical protein